MHFEIDRQRWRRGTGGSKEEETLIDHMGEGCIMGLIGQACGIPQEELQTSYFPSFTDSYDKWPYALIQHKQTDEASMLEIRLAAMNDEKDLPDTDREGQLQDILKPHAIELTFYN